MAQGETLLQLEKVTARTKDGYGGETLTWTAVGEPVVGRVRNYGHQSYRIEELAAAMREGKLQVIVFDQPAPVTLAKEQDYRFVVVEDSEKLRVLHFRPYEFTFQVDVEVYD